MYSLPDGDPCSGHNTMLGALIADDGSLMSHEDPDDVVETMMLTHDDDGDGCLDDAC